MPSWYSSTILFVKESPNPQPLFLVVNPGSNICSISFGSIPFPESFTSIDINGYYEGLTRDMLDSSKTTDQNTLKEKLKSPIDFEETKLKIYEIISLSYIRVNGGRIPDCKLRDLEKNVIKVLGKEEPKKTLREKINNK